MHILLIWCLQDTAALQAEIQFQKVEGASLAFTASTCMFVASSLLASSSKATAKCSFSAFG